jgi:GMP synthase-like glutamine amidotransferase
MKLAILATGAPPTALQPEFGDYPGMFRRLLGETAYDYAAYDVAAGQLPASAGAHDAYLITGAAAGVYDPLPWIAPLKDFLVAAKGQAALVGVCFGHQVMAEAFGGKVIKSPKGWGLGEQTYEVLSHRPWMDEARRVRAPASHQDQVVEAPPGAEVVAGNDFAPFGMLAYRDQPAISIQLHPEFEPVYAKALITGRRSSRFTPEEADEAIRSFEQPDDRARLGEWIRRFLATSNPA